MARTQAAVDTLVQNRLVARIDLALPGSLGVGVVRVHYLTHRAARWLRREFPALACYARPGRPVGTIRDRLAHDLLVTEAYLHVHARCAIHEFHPESTLRTANLKAREFSRLRGGQTSEGMGDFTVLVGLPGRSGVKRLECEVAVALDADQILAKPEDLRWFVPTEHKADVIESLRGRRPTVLGDVRAPEVEKDAVEAGDEISKEVPLNLSRVEAGSLRALSKLGGFATADAIAKIYGEHRSGVSRALTRLQKRGLVRRRDVSLNPGREQGRPARVFFDPQRPSLSLCAAKHALIVSRLVATFGEESFGFQNYNRVSGTLELDNRWEGKEMFIAVVDNEDKSIESIYQIYLGERNRHSDDGAEVVVAMATESRMRELNGLDPTVEIVDVAKRKPSKGGTNSLRQAA